MIDRYVRVHIHKNMSEHEVIMYLPDNTEYTVAYCKELNSDSSFRFYGRRIFECPINYLKCTELEKVAIIKSYTDCLIKFLEITGDRNANNC